MVSLGSDVLSAHLFIVYFAAISAITPPVAVAAFAAASISGANPMTIAFKACRIGIVAFIIPLLFLDTPALLLNDDFLQILKSFLITLVACYALAGVNERYMMGTLRRVPRIVLVIGIVMALAGSDWISVAGCVVMLAIIARQKFSYSVSTSSDQLSRKGT